LGFAVRIDPEIIFMTSLPTVALKVPWQAYLVIALGIIATSSGSIFIKLAQAEGVPSLLIAAARMTIATLVLTPIIISRYRSELPSLNRRQLVLASLSGFFLALHFATWIKSFEYTIVLVSVVLVSTNPLWAAALEVIFLRARLSRIILISLVIGIIGSLIVALPTNQITTLGNSPVLGSLLALIGAMAVAVYFVIGRKLRASLSLVPYIWLVYGCAAIFLVIVVIVSGIPLTGYSLQGYVWLVAMALVPQLIGHSSFNFALKYFPASYVGIAGQLEPVLSTILAFLIFTEIPASVQIIGSIIILSGVVLASLSQSRSD
jgi:drug/metabolite transporter (DMT)-like permease